MKLEEPGVEYRVEVVVFPQPDDSGADPRNPNPHGYARVLDHDGRIVTETDAVALVPDRPVH